MLLVYPQSRKFNTICALRKANLHIATSGKTLSTEPLAKLQRFNIQKDLLANPCRLLLECG